MRRMMFEAPVPVVLVCSSPARAGTSAGAAVGPIVGCGWSTVVPGVAGLVEATAGLCSPCIGTAVAGGGVLLRVAVVVSQSRRPHLHLLADTALKRD